MQPLPSEDADLLAWLVPISGENPCGEDARYDPLYERIRMELAKLEAVAAAPVDWPTVRGAADSLLRHQCKDLFVAAALARAMQLEEGLPGFARGLQLLARLMADFGAALYPTRPRAKAGALSWLVEQALRDLERPASVDGDVLAQIDASFASLSESSRLLLGDSAPSLNGLRDALGRMQLSVAAPPVNPASTEHHLRTRGETRSLATASEPPAVQPTSARANAHEPPAGSNPHLLRAALATVQVPTELTTTSECAEHAEKLAAGLVELGQHAFQRDRTASIAYRSMRAGLWLHIDAPPPHEDDGTTSIPPPDDIFYERLPLMMQHGAWDELLESAEGALPNARFWLDLHFYCDRALAALGAPYASARDAARAGVAALLLRMPRIASLKFADGKPLARPDTAAWLCELSSGSGGPHAPHRDERAPPVALALDGNLGGGTSLQRLAEFDDARRSAGSARERFQLDLRLASALSEAEHTVPALAIFEALEAQVRTHNLELWEPSVAAELLTAYLRCLGRLGSGFDKHAARVEELQVRLAAVSPRAMVSIAEQRASSPQ